MTVHTPIGVRDRGVPRWALGLTVFLFLVGGVYLLGNLGGENPPLAMPGASQPAATGGADPGRGAALIEQVQPACTLCHGQDLGGTGTAPTLQQIEEGPVSENLQQLGEDHPEEWVALWIDGTTPETEGIDRMGMPAFGEQLSREEIDAIVAYLRSL